MNKNSKAFISKKTLKQNPQKSNSMQIADPPLSLNNETNSHFEGKRTF